MDNYIDKEVSMTEKIVGQIRTGMKPTELMIGDWVLHFNKPCKVLGIKDIHKGHDAILLFGQNGFRRTGVEPIPLTEEILEKNGFVKVNTQRYDWGNPNGFYVNINPKKKIVHINGANGSNCNLYYLIVGFNVHQLQHALRLCGLDDLADSIII